MPDYRANLFELIPSLQILDNCNKDGEDMLYSDPEPVDENEAEEEDEDEGSEEEDSSDQENLKKLK